MRPPLTKQSSPATVATVLVGEDTWLEGPDLHLIHVNVTCLAFQLLLRIYNYFLKRGNMKKNSNCLLSIPRLVLMIEK